jgi:hypothetical protein
LRTSLAIILATASAITAAPAFAAERNFPVTDFEQIVLAGSTDISVTTGSRASVVAVGADADIDRLDIRVEGNRLLVGTKKGNWTWSTREGVKLRVTVPNLSAATISGSGDMDINRVKGPFSGRVSGSGDMSIAAVDSTTLNLAISGSGEIEAASGRCGAGNFATTGSGDIDAANVRCETLSATVTGSGNVDGQATATATLRVTGSGNVKVTGGARCTTSTTGSGTTRCS